MVTKTSTKSKSTKTNSTQKGRSNAKTTTQMRKKQSPKKQVPEVRVVQNSFQSVTYPRTLAIVALAIEATVTALLIIPGFSTRILGVLLLYPLSVVILVLSIVSLVGSGRVTELYRTNTRMLALLGLVGAIISCFIMPISAPFALTVNCLCLFIALLSTLSLKSDIAER